MEICIILRIDIRQVEMYYTSVDNKNETTKRIEEMRNKTSEEKMEEAI
ncbi:MAG: hypothetical protein R3Y58_12990 [Eubacteriales bacterium]